MATLRKEVKSLLDMLTNGTSKGAIRWQESSTKGRIYAELRGKSVHLWRWVDTFSDGYDDHSREVIAMNLLDGQGEEVFKTDFGEGDDGYLAVRQLYDDALFQARNTGNFIDELISEIQLKVK